jgi:hypothetical protein
LQVRIPEWAGYAKVAFSREKDGQVTHGAGHEPSRWVNEHFLQLGAAEAGETITIEFPLSRRQTVETAIGQTFITEWQGDDVIGISPQGTRHPFYSGRKVYEQAPLREGDYERPERELVW